MKIKIPKLLIYNRKGIVDAEKEGLELYLLFFTFLIKYRIIEIIC